MDEIKKHTPGPWSVSGGVIVGPPNGGLVAEIADFVTFIGSARPSISAAERDRNAARAVACVNACEGINDPALALKSIRRALAFYDESPSDRRAMELSMVVSACFTE